LVAQVTIKRALGAALFLALLLAMVAPACRLANEASRCPDAYRERFVPCGYMGAFRCKTRECI
jgi:hypothetical protein